MLYLLTIAQIGAVRLFSAKAREMHSCKARETIEHKGLWSVATKCFMQRCDNRTGQLQRHGPCRQGIDCLLTLARSDSEKAGKGIHREIWFMRRPIWPAR